MLTLFVLLYRIFLSYKLKKLLKKNYFKLENNN